MGILPRPSRLTMNNPSIASETGTLFQQQRQPLFRLAYRMLGQVGDAEDIVQECFVTLLKQPEPPASPAAWLRTVCTRKCLDVLKSAHHQRSQYPGPWLPEPLVDDALTWQAHQEQVQTAFLVLLQKLPPRQRAAYILHQLFDESHQAIADTLGLSVANTRQLVSRAARRIEADASPQTDEDQQLRLLEAFQKALADGNLDSLRQLLANDVRLSADGGGKVIAAPRVLAGCDEVLDFLRRIVRPHWQRYRWHYTAIQGLPGVMLYHGNRVEAVLTLEAEGTGSAAHTVGVQRPDGPDSPAGTAGSDKAKVEDGTDGPKIRQFFIQRNPDKLHHIHMPVRSLPLPLDGNHAPSPSAPGNGHP